MPAAIPIGKREEIVSRRKDGESFARIGRQMGMAYGTVRKIWQHYGKNGELSPAYERCAHREVRKEKAIYERAIALKRAHPGWGGGLMWVELAEEFDEASLPSERTLQRWFHRGGVAVSKPQDRGRQSPVERGQTVHAVWAMDAKEDMRLGDGSRASWLVISDEASGAMLHTALFPRETLAHRGSASGKSRHPGGIGMLGEAEKYPRR